MVQYVKMNCNLRSAKDKKAKIAMIDAIIDSLLTTALAAVANSDTVEYTIDTGQSKQHRVFATTESITKAIKSYESIRNMYANSGSRVFRMIDEKNFNGGTYGSSF